MAQQTDGSVIQRVFVAAGMERASRMERRLLSGPDGRVVDPAASLLRGHDPDQLSTEQVIERAAGAMAQQVKAGLAPLVLRDVTAASEIRAHLVSLRQELQTLRDQVTGELRSVGRRGFAAWLGQLGGGRSDTVMALPAHLVATQRRLRLQARLDALQRALELLSDLESFLDRLVREREQITAKARQGAALLHERLQELDRASLLPSDLPTDTDARLLALQPTEEPTIAQGVGLEVVAALLASHPDPEPQLVAETMLERTRAAVPPLGDLEAVARAIGRSLGLSEEDGLRRVVQELQLTLDAVPAPSLAQPGTRVAHQVVPDPSRAPITLDGTKIPDAVFTVERPDRLGLVAYDLDHSLEDLVTFRLAQSRLALAERDRPFHLTRPSLPPSDGHAHPQVDPGVNRHVPTSPSISRSSS